MTVPVLVVGGGGHAKVVVEALLAGAALIAGIVDPDPELQGQRVLAVPVIGGDEAIREYPPEEVRLVNGIGSIALPLARRAIYEKFTAQGYRFAALVHPSAVLASDLELADGVQVMAGAVIQPGCRIGPNAIVNTRASIDHDCVIGDHAHIAPGVTLSGGVTIGEGCHVGTGATVIQGVSIGAGSLVGAGAVVTKDVAAGSVVVGVPARVVQR